MHVHFLDPYRTGASPVHQLDARIKLALTLAFILACALTPSGAWPVYIVLLSLVVGVGVLSEIGIGYVARRSALALPFILAALPLLFTVKGESLLSFEVGRWLLSISLPGLERFLSIAVKSWISVQAAILLSATTSFPDLLLAMRALRVPRLLVAIFGLMWRYLFILVDEALRLLRARTARSGESDLPGLKKGGSLAWRAQVAGGMAGNLFLRGFERSDRIYMAMVARGYDGEVRSLALPPIRPSSWAVLALGLFMLAGLLGIGLLVW